MTNAIRDSLLKAVKTDKFYSLMILNMIEDMRVSYEQREVFRSIYDQIAFKLFETNTSKNIIIGTLYTHRNDEEITKILNDFKDFIPVENLIETVMYYIGELSFDNLFLLIEKYPDSELLLMFVLKFLKSNLPVPESIVTKVIELDALPSSKVFNKYSSVFIEKFAEIPKILPVLKKLLEKYQETEKNPDSMSKIHKELIKSIK